MINEVVAQKPEEQALIKDNEFDQFVKKIKSLQEKQANEKIRQSEEKKTELVKKTAHYFLCDLVILACRFFKISEKEILKLTNEELEKLSDSLDKKISLNVRIKEVFYFLFPSILGVASFIKGLSIISSPICLLFFGLSSFAFSFFGKVIIDCRRCGYPIRYVDVFHYRLEKRRLEKVYGKNFIGKITEEIKNYKKIRM